MVSGQVCRVGAVFDNNLNFKAVVFIISRG